MRISMVIPSFYPATVYGGTIFSSLHSARSLVARGHEVWVSTTNTNMHGKLDVPINTFTEMEPGLMVKYYDETIVDKFSWPLFRGLREDLEPADAVHIQAIFNTPVPRALHLAQKLGKPTLLSPRGVLGDWIMGQGNPMKKWWLKRFIAPHIQRIRWHATSLQEREEILHRFPESTISEVPNGVDLGAFQQPEFMDASAFHQAFGGPQVAAPGTRIISMGRIHPKKGFDILIRAFHYMLENYPDAHLYIAGQDEGAKSDLLVLRQHLGLDERIHFPGSLKGQDKVNFLGNASLFALPSHNENFGNVYAESLAAGTPIVASTATPWEGVVDAGCGAWVPNGVSETREAMEDILSRDAEGLSLKGRAYVKRYDWPQIGAAFESLFSELISTSQPEPVHHA